MDNINVQFVAKSSNSKTGPIPVTNSDRNSCPDTCPLKDNGCYASAGYYTRMNWDKVTSGERGGDWTSLCDKVSKLKDGQTWRHNVSGDLPHKNGLIDDRKLYQLINANRGKHGFTYTHHSMKSKRNRLAIESANHNGFTVNLSADNKTEADKLADLGIAPVVCILPGNALAQSITPQGRKIITCPATYKDDVSCATCKLCASSAPNRPIIGFPVHGIHANKIEV